jgi:hypothetical protein
MCVAQAFPDENCYGFLTETQCFFMFRIIFTSALLSAAVCLSAQTTPAPVAPGTRPAGLSPRDSAVMKLFDQPASVQWIRTFKGRIDDVAQADITLGFDGRQCKGFLMYPKNRLRFRLEGTFPDSNRLRLEERDANNQVSGRLEGRIHGRHLSADWINHDNTLGTRVEADEPTPGQILSTGCGDNKWTARYLTRFNNARADMVLSRQHNGYLYGYLWIEADAKTYLLRGEASHTGKFSVKVFQPGQKQSATLTGDLKNPQEMEVKWTGNETREFKFVQRERLITGCLENADYKSISDALYPRTSCAACNTWFEQRATAWFNKSKSTLSADKVAPAPDNRNKQRGSAWTEVVCWTENIFTGYFVFSETWNPAAQGVAFNLDLRKGKEIKLTDLFNKSFEAEKWLADYCKKESPKMPQYAADAKYREWLAANGFPLIAIHREGLQLATHFHPEYGQQFLIVPYADLKPYMKKDNPIADLIK